MNCALVFTTVTLGADHGARSECHCLEELAMEREEGSDAGLQDQIR